jgi:hypothetical protein
VESIVAAIFGVLLSSLKIGININSLYYKELEFTRNIKIG